MVRGMGNPWFGSKATSGLCQALVALMPPHSVYIETHLGGGAIMRRKPAALRNIGIDLDARALESFGCGHPVELVNADCHAYLAEFPFDGSELVYSDPPYLRATRKSGRRYRHDYGDADHEALLELLKGLPCAAMVSGYPSALYDELLRGWRSRCWTWWRTCRNTAGRTSAWASRRPGCATGRRSGRTSRATSWCAAPWSARASCSSGSR